MLALLGIIHECKLEEERLNHINQLNMKTQKNIAEGHSAPSPAGTLHTPAHLSISPADSDSKFPWSVLGVQDFKQTGGNSSQKHQCKLIAAARSIILVGIHHLTTVYSKGGLALECPHQTIQHLHESSCGTLTRCRISHSSAELLWLQVLGCRDLFGAAVWSHSPFPSVLPHTSGKQTGCHGRGSSTVLKAHNPGQAEAGADGGWDVVYGRLYLPAAAYMGFTWWGCKLLNPPFISILGTERKAKGPHFS